MSKRSTFFVAAVVLAAVAWYFFRPDRAFIDSRVSEASPNAAATVLLAGEFRSRTHEGRGLAQVLELPDGQRVLRFSSFENSVQREWKTGCDLSAVARQTMTLLSPPS